MEVNLARFTKKCGCGKSHTIQVEKICIEGGAVKYLDEVLQPYSHPVILCDKNTKKAVEETGSDCFQKYEFLLLTGGEIHADNMHVDDIQSSLPGNADVLVAAGSGSIHDLARYVAAERNIPFVSLPTAASVDGFVSTVAAMTWHGMKKTCVAKAPVCVLADTDIFSKAPYRLTASGISDLLGKYTALVDWKTAHIITGEYFCQSIYDLEKEAVDEVDRVLDKIKAGDRESMEKLMYALILSGLAMQMAGNSRPASGAEHQISHLWEMAVINEPVDALHGEKVSAGLILTLKEYEKICLAIEEGRIKLEGNSGYETRLLKDTFGRKGMYEAILEENGNNILEEIDLEDLRKKLLRIGDELRKLPGSEETAQKLQRAGCVTSMSEIGIPEEMKQLTLRLSPYVRRKLTVLRLSKVF